MKKLSLLFIIAFALLNPNLSYSDNMGSITVQIKDTSFHTLNVEPGFEYLLVYQDFSTNPFMRIDSLTTNPYTISNLPLGHQYKIEVYLNHVFGGVGYVDLKSATNLDLIVPLSGGMRFIVLYNDGKPIPNANVAIQSQDRNTWQTIKTDPQGITSQLWLQSPSRDQDYYIANVTIGNSISFSYQPIRLLPGSAQDFKITTPWPSIVSNLITVSVYNGTKKITPSDGNFTVELYNKTGIVGKSDVNKNGEVFFSNLKVDNYIFKVFKTTSDLTNPAQLWGSTNAIINGSQNSISIFKSNITNDTQSSETAKQNCKCVAFRLDDIQDYYLRNQQEKVMDVFLEKNASLTIGIIGNFFGTDKQLLDYLQTRVKSKGAPIEIANNGWNHEDFAKFSEADQSSLINKTNQKIFSIFGVKPTTFLLPFNNLNNDTYKAAEDNGITHLSSVESPKDKPPYPLTNENLYRFPQTASTSRHDQQGILVNTSHDYVIQQIKKSMDRNGFAVVMMAPQDFSTIVNKTYTRDNDLTQITELRTLIDDIRNSGFKIVTIDHISLDTPRPNENVEIDKSTIPEWVKHIALWWQQGEITDTDFKQGIGYLVKEKIVVIQNAISKPTSSTSQQIPVWIKDNAGLWAHGQISKKEFANGMNYLITNGIIIH